LLSLFVLSPVLLVSYQNKSLPKSPMPCSLSSMLSWSYSLVLDLTFEFLIHSLADFCEIRIQFIFWIWLSSFPIYWRDWPCYCVFLIPVSCMSLFEDFYFFPLVYVSIFMLIPYFFVISLETGSHSVAQTWPGMLL
jgi:hypothetical protein